MVPIKSLNVTKLVDNQLNSPLPNHLLKWLMHQAKLARKSSNQAPLDSESENKLWKTLLPPELGKL